MKPLPDIVVEYGVRADVAILAIALLQVQIVGNGAQCHSTEVPRDIRAGTIDGAIEQAFAIELLGEGISAARAGVTEEVAAPGRLELAQSQCIGKGGAPGVVAFDLVVVAQAVHLEEDLAIV